MAQGVDASKLRLFFFGIIRQGKGLEVILRLLENDHVLQEQFELHIVGTVLANAGSRDNQLLQRIIDASYAVHHGYVYESDLGMLLASCDVFILPFDNGVSERRGSFMTGMAFGKPVITTRPPSPIEGLVNMHNVIFLNELGGSEMKAVLTTVASMNREELYHIGRNAKAWYESLHSDQSIVRRLLAILTVR
jgi:glycosyltransferase involved in cell wall biosynthesis